MHKKKENNKVRTKRYGGFPKFNLRDPVRKEKRVKGVTNLFLVYATSCPR